VGFCLQEQHLVEEEPHPAANSKSLFAQIH
jgi:hypothetical protein